MVVPIRLRQQTIWFPVHFRIGIEIALVSVFPEPSDLYQTIVLRSLDRSMFRNVDSEKVYTSLSPDIITACTIHHVDIGSGLSEQPISIGVSKVNPPETIYRSF